MGEPIDPDDLVDAAGVADALGLSRRTAVSVYRARYPDFPLPRVTRGRCELWLRSDVEAWAKATGRSA